MELSNSIQSNYDSNAEAYAQFITLPLGTLEQQLLDLCITNLDGQRVLDLGGGTGIRARDALAAGASAVDVVDISPSMMRIGQEYESSISRDGTGPKKESKSKSKTRWFEADVSKPLDHLSLELDGYDLVIANGIFDHASTTAELEGMWSNTARYLKRGGRVVANRNNPLSKCARPEVGGRYGVTFTDLRPLSTGDGEGVQYKYHMHTQPELVFESKALESYYLAGEEGEGGMAAARKWFDGFENVRWEDTPVVKGDVEFWRDYLEDPILFIYTARKK